MSILTDYTELEVWKQSRSLVFETYKLSEKFPKAEQFGLISQIRRSVISVPSNIAEGIGRQHTKESIQFMYIAKGSLFELETQLILAYDLGYISNETLEKVKSAIHTCKKLISGYIRYLNKK